MSQIVSHKTQKQYIHNLFIRYLLYVFFNDNIIQLIFFHLLIFVSIR